jgi:ATP-dependent RNA helicase DeaD
MTKSHPTADLPSQTFDELGLPDCLLQAITDLGFTTPTPIQAQVIPALIMGHDIVGVAQTGTGKTAAFGLPLLAGIDADVPEPQAVVLTPTRELAMQVARAIESFATAMPGLRVLTVYGGAPWLPQKRALERGVHVVIGTPGRLIDHLDRGTLSLDHVRFLVLDEGDEMLSMGFADEMDTILGRAPAERQTALFSATMPQSIRSTVRKHLRDPLEIAVARQASTVANVEQRFAVVPGKAKIGALTRVLALSDAEAAIVFVRTRSAAEEVGQALAQRGLNAATMSGKIVQQERERIIERLRMGELDILVATDVAARGLDVDRVGLVVNYDLPHDSEGYVHRVGRTGRAGRSGVALSFVGPKEVKKLRAIEKTIQIKLVESPVPSAAEVAHHKATAMVDKAVRRIEAGHLGVAQAAVSHAIAAGIDPVELATALTALAVGDAGGADGHARADADLDRAMEEARFERADRPNWEPRQRGKTGGKVRGGQADERPWKGKERAGQKLRPRDTHAYGATPDRPVRARSERHQAPVRKSPGRPETYWVGVGRRHGALPRALVDAIADEGGVRARDIGQIDIFDHFSLVDIDRGLSRDALRRLAQTHVSGQTLRIRPHAAGPHRGRR